MKYQLTQEELSTLAFYMTLQMYKKAGLWVITAIAALLVKNIIDVGGGFFSWLASDIILMVLFFLLFYFSNFGTNQKALERTEVILENGRMRHVSEEGEYGTSFKVREITRKKSYRGLLILTREIWGGEGKGRICLGKVYYAFPERIFENREEKEAFLAKIEEQANAPLDPEETAGGKDPLYTFEGNTTEESLAKLRDLNEKYRISKKGKYRFWLKTGLFMFGFLTVQLGWILIRAFHAMTNASLSFDRLQFGEFLFLMLGVLAGMICMTLKSDIRGQLRRVRKSKKEQANLGESTLYIFEKHWVMSKQSYEAILDWKLFAGIVEFEDSYLFIDHHKNAFFMMSKEKEDPEKLNSFISYCKERGNYEVYKEPEKWSLGKKIFTVIICIFIFLVIGAAGLTRAAIEKSEKEEVQEEFVFYPEEYEDYLPLEQQLEVLEQLDFTFSQESLEYIQDWMTGEYADYGRLYVEGYPYYELLMELGYPKYDEETWEVVEYSTQAYWLDFEGWDIAADYIQILKGVAAMSDGELEFTDMKEDIYDVDWEKGTGTIDVTFKCNGNTYKFEANVMNDWIDADFIGYINEVLDDEGYTKNLYACYDGGQGNVLFYRDEAWADKFVNLTGIQLGLEAQ